MKLKIRKDTQIWFQLDENEIENKTILLKKIVLLNNRQIESEQTKLETY